MPEPYAVVRFSLRAVIGDHVFNDVVQFAANFELNSIPEGAITVAVGRRVDTQKAATIHSAIKDLKVQLPAKVYLTAVVTDYDRADAALALFAQPKLIFEGNAVGTGWQRSNEAANFTIHLVHWIAQLHYASSVNPSAHPGNPGDWQHPAAFKRVGSTDDADAGAGKREVAWVPGMSKRFATRRNLSDLWGNVLQPWMVQIAGDEPFDNRLKRAGITTGNARQNATLAALKRLGPNKSGTPLNVDLSGGDDSVIANAICSSISNKGGEGWLNTTLWGKLVGEWGPAYSFAVVPRVTDGMIVPFTGGLQGDPWARIRDVDYIQCEASAQLHQVLRAVGIVFPATSATGFNGLPSGPTTNLTGLYGVFAPPGITDGLVLIKHPPEWLCNKHLIYSGVETSTGEVNARAIGTSLDAAGTGKPKVAPKNAAEVWKKNQSFANRYAQHWYAMEMLKGRTGELSGKLRFDIAPGSNVLIEAGTAKNLAQHEDALTESVYATVGRVSFVINAESSKAGTSFSIAHIRTAAENQSLTTSVEKPPLYLNAWRGAALIE